MSQTFTKVSFSLVVTPQEATLMEEIATTILDIAALDAVGQAAAYREMSDAFRSHFAPGEDGPFAAYLALSTDPEFVELGVSIEVRALEDGKVEIFVRGNDVDVESLAHVIRAVCPSAMPFGFTYAFGSDNLTNGDFGGGYALIGHDAVKVMDTTEALAAALMLDGDIQPLLVLASTEIENGILFWNETEGFGSLEMASALTPAQISLLESSFTDKPAQWLTLPRRRS